MAKRDSFLLRIKPEMLEALRAWADDEFRSLNGQIEFALHRALEQAGRLPKSQRASPVDAGDKPNDNGQSTGGPPEPSKAPTEPSQE